MFGISNAIAEGANAFLRKEYEFMSIFLTLFGLLLFVLLGTLHSWMLGVFSTVAFFTGALTSIASGFIGMRVAVYANSRTALSAQRGYEFAFDTAFKGGAVMGFALTSLGMIMLFVLITAFHFYYSSAFKDEEETKIMFEAIAGYGLGGSTVALFGRVGGGIYTKAADVGGDLAGKMEAGLREDDPRNPAVIADNVGDNVGDIAGMGADLFGSFAESACAAMVISSQSPDLYSEYPAMTFPLVLAACGIVVCLLTTFVATNLKRVKGQKDVEPSLKRQLLVSTVLMTPVVYVLTHYFYPDTFVIGGGVEANEKHATPFYIFITVSAGLWR